MNLKGVIELLFNLGNRKFHGDVLLRFNSGVIVHIEQKESLDLKELGLK